MLEIEPYNVGRCCLTVPGSKSYTHRALIAASLCKEPCSIYGNLKSDDITMTLSALEKLGVSIFYSTNHLVLNGVGGRFQPFSSAIYLGNSGASMRFITGLVTLGQGTYTLVGSSRMYDRPIFHLIHAMNQLGVKVNYLQKYGFPPLEIVCSKIVVDFIKIDCSISSQYLSALLLIAPCFVRGLTIFITGEIVSRPYIDITIDIMRKFGILIERNAYDSFYIPPNQFYSAINYNVEPDCSHACYFWAAAAITGGSVTVKGINFNSKQGDLKFLECLKRMGCVVYSDQVGITVIGGVLKGIDVNMSDMPDAVPTLAVVASFAKGITKITGVYHLKNKESNRIKSVSNELRRMGIVVESNDQEIVIRGGNPKGTTICTYNDHRIAMSFAIAGLRVKGVKITKESCVVKSFPKFWERFNILYKS